MAKSRIINWLGPEWEWIYKEDNQQWEYTDVKGVTHVSTERHGYNTKTGQNLSVRQIQNMQRVVREQQEQPKSIAVARQGKIRTIRGKELRRGKLSVEGKGLYSEEKHGRVEKLAFYSILDAQNWIAQNPEYVSWAKYSLLQARYTQRYLIVDGSNPKLKDGYTTLSGGWQYVNNVLIPGAQRPTLETIAYENGIVDNPWNTAANDLISNYDMSGKNARFYVVLFER